MQVKVRDKTYHVEIHQHRKNSSSLVMLHGFLGSGRVFGHLLPDLAKFINPVTIDLLGHGSTEGDHRPERYRFDEQVKDLFLILKSFLPDPIYLHGYSMGGRLALHYALAHPGTVKGLILESTTYGIASADKQAVRRKMDEQRASDIETDFEQFLDYWGRLPLFENNRMVPDALSKLYKTIQQNQSPSSMANSLRGFGTGFMPPVRSDLVNLNIPVLILAGETDVKFRSLAYEMHQMLPASNLSIIEKAGHRVHLENPEDFVQEVKSFLAEASGTEV